MLTPSQNIIWVFALFWYQIYANFDCSYAFDYTYILLFNLAFTSLPIIFQGILDQDVDDKVSLAVPQLYRRGIEQKEWTQTKFWIYMFDGFYQSVICFYFTYLMFMPANFVTDSGHNVNDYKRIGVYIVNPTVVVVNIYILINTYRWDWFMVLITAISIVLVFIWTGAYTAVPDSFTFYGSGAQVYGQLTFWAVGLLTIIMSLLPRFAAKAFQKMYMPMDIDIIREQVRQGKFDYLKEIDPQKVGTQTEKVVGSATSSEMSQKPPEPKGHRRNGSPPTRPTMEEDMRPIYPPSIAGTATTLNPRSHNGSDGTDYTGHRSSTDRAFPPSYAGANVNPTITRADYDIPTSPQPATRASYERSRPSFDRLRSSMDRTRPSFEASRDFTSAAYLAKIESNQDGGSGAGSSRKPDLNPELRKQWVAADKRIVQGGRIDSS
jgi:phospholipid-translocating ATPase